MNLFSATVMDCIAEIGLDPNGVQKCVEVNCQIVHPPNYLNQTSRSSMRTNQKLELSLSQEAIGTASDCWDCVCWVMESVGLGCPTA